MDDTLAHSYVEYARFSKLFKDCKVVSYQTAYFSRAVWPFLRGQKIR